LLHHSSAASRLIAITSTSNAFVSHRNAHKERQSSKA
jgi:hypothetical protein